MRRPKTWVVRAKDVMSGDFPLLGPDDSLAHAAAVMAENGVDCVPVAVDGVPVGMITGRDIVDHIRRGGGLDDADLIETMSAVAPTVRENDPLRWVCASSIRLGAGRLLVVNDKGLATGIITQTDLLRAFMRETPDF